MSLSTNGVNFKSNLNPYSPVDTNLQQKYQRTESYQTDTFEKQNNDSNKNKKIAAGIIGAAAVIGLGILALRKGRKPNEATTNGIKSEIENLTKNAQKVTNEVENTAKEVQEKAARELQEKAAREAQEKAAREAQEKAAREAQEKAAREAQEKAAKEVQEKAAREAKEKAAKEAQEAEVMAAKRAAKEAASIESRKWASDYVDKNMKKFDEMFLDENGNFTVLNPDRKVFTKYDKTVDFKSLVSPYEGELGTLYHGTNSEYKAKILKDGFKRDVDLPIKHGNRDGIGGTYFSLRNIDGYGNEVIKAKFNGKVAEVDTEFIEYVFKDKMRMKTGCYPKWKEGATVQECVDIKDAAINRYLQNKLREMGYDGLVNKHSAAAGCQYFAAIDPKLIEIIK